jgi:hypothetical protein
VKHLGPRTIYLLSAFATVVLVAAAGLAASGIDIGRPRSSDLPLLVARSASRPLGVGASTVPTITTPAPAPAPAAAPAPASSPQGSGEGDPGSGGSVSTGSRRAPTTDAHPAAVAPPPPVVIPPPPPPHDHEVVTPPVRESDEHRQSAPAAPQTQSKHD